MEPRGYKGVYLVASEFPNYVATSPMRKSIHLHPYKPSTGDAYSQAHPIAAWEQSPDDASAAAVIFPSRHKNQMQGKVRRMRHQYFPFRVSPPCCSADFGKVGGRRQVVVPICRAEAARDWRWCRGQTASGGSTREGGHHWLLPTRSAGLGWRTAGHATSRLHPLTSPE